MKTFTYPLIAAIVVACGILGSVPTPAPADVGFARGRSSLGIVGHGHAIHVPFGRRYFPQSGPYGYGNYGFADRWRTAAHWHYYPEGNYLQGNQYIYIPGHYEWHQGGHEFPRDR